MRALSYQAEKRFARFSGMVKEPEVWIYGYFLQ
jgi:hypothetical protein